MRRVMAAVSAALAISVLAACSPDVVPIAGPGQPTPTPEGTSPKPGPVCGDDTTGPDQEARMISPQDVWPGADFSGQGVQNFRLDPVACQARLIATPAPLRPTCENGFPYFTQDDMVTEMARIGVVHIAETQDLDLRADGSTVSTVDEVLLDLGIAAAPRVAALATGCGAERTAGYYTASAGSGDDTLLQIEPEFAVAVTFDQHVTLSDKQRADVLRRAVSLAGT
jgi:hypothetical protein